MQHKPIHDRMADLEADRAVFEKLATINDPIVARYLDQRDEVLSAQILQTIAKAPQEAQVLAFQREALRYIRNLITGADHTVANINKQMTKLNERANA